MKPVENRETVDINYQNSCLGFSLSPQMNITGAAAETVPPTYYHHTPLHNYGLLGEHVGMFSSLPIMPLKSNVSFYGIEAISRSQPQG